MDFFLSGFSLSLWRTFVRTLSLKHCPVGRLNIAAEQLATVKCQSRAKTTEAGLGGGLRK